MLILNRLELYQTELKQDQTGIIKKIQEYQNESENWFETDLKLVGTGLEQDQTGKIMKIQEFSGFNYCKTW